MQQVESDLKTRPKNERKQTNKQIVPVYHSVVEFSRTEDVVRRRGLIFFNRPALGVVLAVT